ncbi:MAG: App1 family protein, partial [Verrucomicrobiota bacterium]
SSSPWNLYDFLEEVLTVNQIPLGPMFLRDHGLENRRLTLRDHRSHKIQAIEKLLDVFPDLPFLLVGDTGQKDPEIYLEVVQRHSTRIKGVLLRNVTQLLTRRVAEVEQRGREMEDFGCHFCLFEGTEEAEGAVQEWGLMPSSEDAGCEVGDV